MNLPVVYGIGNLLRHYMPLQVIHFDNRDTQLDPTELGSCNQRYLGQEVGALEFHSNAHSSSICQKPGKYGIKIQIPAGGDPQKKQVKHEVLDMRAGLQGHNIICDNFFTLARSCYRKKLTMVGTVRQNRPDLPPVQLTTKDRARFSPKFALTETHTHTCCTVLRETEMTL